MLTVIVTATNREFNQQTLSALLFSYYSIDSIINAHTQTHMTQAKNTHSAYLFFFSSMLCQSVSHQFIRSLTIVHVRLS